MQKTLLGAALASGVCVAWMDSLARWDDAGVTVFALLLSAGIIGFFVRRRAWLFGLAVGLWIPLKGVFLSHDLRFLAVLLIPLAGVYAGRGFRRLARGPRWSS
jgi:hypothetical protein